MDIWRTDTRGEGTVVVDEQRRNVAALKRSLLGASCRDEWVDLWTSLIATIEHSDFCQAQNNTDARSDRSQNYQRSVFSAGDSVPVDQAGQGGMPRPGTAIFPHQRMRQLPQSVCIIR